jgi:hypothetical protein
MLYDTRWDAKIETRIEPTMGRLIEWLEQQPLNMEYNFLDASHCLLGQAFGREASIRETLSFSDLYDVARGWPRTFRAALKRARAHM